METKKHKLIYSDSEKESYFELKKLSKEIQKQTKELNFSINRKFKAKGKIISSLTNYAKRVDLIRVFSKKNKKKGTDAKYEYLTAFIDDSADTRYWNEIDCLSHEFYQYSFISDKQEYTLFSEDELTEGVCSIRGMLVYLSDKLDISRHSNVSAKRPLVFVHTAKSDLRVFSKDELTTWTQTNNLESYEDFMNCFFSLEDGFSYRFPMTLEIFLLSNLLGSKYQTYDNNIFIIGEPGTGKSYLGECCSRNFEENMADCSSSSLKGIIPSFKNTPPDPGHLLRSKRISPCDEFLRVLNRTRYEDRQDQLASMNNLLEHKRQTRSAGTGSITASMTAQALFVSNPLVKGERAYGLVKKIENSFLSRFIILFLGEEHKVFVNNKKKNPEKSKKILPAAEWLSLYDTCKTFSITLDQDRLREIDEMGLNFFQQEQLQMKGVYEARSWHNLNCFAEGFIKLRCILEGDRSLAARDSDYKCIRGLWGNILLSWGLNPPGGNSVKADLKILRNTFLRVEQKCPEHYAKSVNENNLEVLTQSSVDKTLNQGITLSPNEESNSSERIKCIFCGLKCPKEEFDEEFGACPLCLPDLKEESIANIGV